MKATPAALRLCPHEKTEDEEEERVERRGKHVEKDDEDNEFAAIPMLCMRASSSRSVMDARTGSTPRSTV